MQTGTWEANNGYVLVIYWCLVSVGARLVISIGGVYGPAVSMGTLLVGCSTSVYDVY